MNLTKSDKEMLRSEFSKVWRKRDGGIDDKMVDYCVKKASAMMVIGDVVVTFDKPSIKTRFCFGYGCQSAYDYDEAIDAAESARHSVSHFINENIYDTDAGAYMKYIMDECFPFEPWLTRRAYCSQDDDCRLGDVTWTHWTKRDYAESQGWRRLTDDELVNYYKILFEEQMKFCKRLRTYLKRYGLSKVQSWSYWADE